MAQGTVHKAQGFKTYKNSMAHNNILKPKALRLAPKLSA
jgi:hypothetical protein